MKNIQFILFLSVILLWSCQVAEKEQEGRIPAQYSIEQFYDNLRVTGGSFSPDRTKLLVSSNITGIFNAMSIPLDGSDPVPLTQSEKESIFAVTYLPQDERFIYSADRGGDEINHLYLYDLEGNVQDLTPGENEKASFAGWARDLNHLYYISNGRDPNFFDLYKMSIEDWSSEMIYENKEGLNVNLISDDEQYFVLTKTITTTSNQMFLVDKNSGEMKTLSNDNEEANYAPQYFSLDNKSLYYLTDEGNEFQYVVRYNLDSGEKTKVHESEWDVWYVYESWNGKYRVIGTNEDAKTVVRLYDTKTNEEIEFPDIEGKSVSGVSISRDEKLMRFTAANSKAPSDIYVYDFETKEYTQLTNTLNPEIDVEDLVEGTVVRYQSFDGLDIPAIFYRPQQASAENKVPAMVWVHGGPGGQSRVNYFELIQYMVNQGYAILAVNNRGSSGYGKSFFKMDNQKHGDVDLKDCVYGKKYLTTLDYIDESKIGIIGGSYGGYMTMAALTFTPEEFDVGVNIFGVTNWLRTLKSIPPWWESFKNALYEEMGDPFSADSIRLHKISPLFHTEQVTKPLMVLQGANDPRVLQVESDEIVEGVKANGVPVEYVLFEDEGHGFRKKENQIKGYGQVVAFLDKYLKQEGPVAD